MLIHIQYNPFNGFSLEQTDVRVLKPIPATDPVLYAVVGTEDDHPIEMLENTVTDLRPLFRG